MARQLINGKWVDVQPETTEQVKARMSKDAMAHAQKIKADRDKAAAKAAKEAAKKEAAKNKKIDARLAKEGGIDPRTGRPTLAKHKSSLDKKGKLAKQYRLDEKSAQLDLKKLPTLDIKNLQPDKTAYNAIKDRAMTKGPSAWAAMQNEKLNLEKENLLGDVSRNAMADQATAESSLAMRGGLSSGSRERVAKAGLNAANMGRQNVFRQDAANRLGLGIADENQKLDLLKTVPGMDMALAGYNADLNRFNSGMTMDANKFNKGVDLDVQRYNSMGGLQGLQGENTYNQYKYGQDMMGWAAEKTGQAIGANKDQGLLGMGGFLGTGIGGEQGFLGTGLGKGGGK